MPRQNPKLAKRECAGCGKLFTPTVEKQIYHSEACRAKAYRQRKKNQAATPYGDPSPWQTYRDMPPQEIKSW